jgi:flagellar basal-body rod protein FlgB
MDMGQIPLFSILTNRMSWLSSRQSVLAENVANAATPDYVARDLKPMDFAHLLGAPPWRPTLATTNVRHIALKTSSPSTGPYAEEDALGDGGTPTGNVVSLEQEMIKLSDTQIQYQTATNIYQKAVNMFRTALGGRGG